MELGCVNLQRLSSSGHAQGPHLSPIAFTTPSVVSVERTTLSCWINQVADNCGQTKARRGNQAGSYDTTQKQRTARRPTVIDWSSRLATIFGLSFVARRLPNGVQPATFVQLCTPRHVYLLNHSADVDFAIHRRRTSRPRTWYQIDGSALGLCFRSIRLSGLELLCLRSTKPLQPPCYSSS